MAVSTLVRDGEGVVMAVDPTGEDLATFRAGDPDSPVVMLNRLRFAEVVRVWRGSC